MKKVNCKNIFKYLFLLLLVLGLFITTGCGNTGGDDNQTDQQEEQQVTYTVSFDFNGEKKDSVNIVVKDGEKVNQIDVTKYTSKELDGWYYNDTKWDFSTSITSNITLVAKWVNVIEKYYASFNTNGGSGEVEDIEFITGDSITIPDVIVSKHGYKFMGWEYYGNLYQANDVVTLDEERDIEFKAKFELICKITYNSNDNTNKTNVSDNIINNSTITLEKNSFTRENYAFLGWSLTEAGEVIYNDEAEVLFNYNKDINLYAIWKQTIFSVTFDFNGEYNDKLYFTVNEDELIPTVDETKYTTKRLDGWYYNDVKWNFETDKVTSDITLVAKWIDVYTLSFDLNNGSGEASSIEFITGVEFNVPSYNITKTGYAFIGWEYDGNIYKANDSITINKKENVEFKAKFELICKITYNSNETDNKTIVSEDIINNSSISLQKNSFERYGYNFLGWSLTSAGDVTYLDEATLTYNYNKNINLYAKWEKFTTELDVIEAINNLGEITYGSLSDVQAARALYNKLDDTAKAKVTNIDNLNEAESDLAIIYIQVLENTNYTSSDVEEARSVTDIVTNKGDITNLDVLYIAEYEELNKTKYSNASSNLSSVLTEVAYAYNTQQNQIQYDQYNGRRNLNAAPEFATSERLMYLDCSGYVNTVYNYTFGVNVMGSDLDDCNTKTFNAFCSQYYGSRSDVIYYVKNSDYTTTTSQTTILNEVKSNLQVGDLLIYRHGASSGSSGHVMLYVGNNTFLHSTGTSTSVTVGTTDPSSFVDKTNTNEAKIGSVQTLSANELFTSTGSRYLFKSTSSDTVYSFGVIRMLNRNGLTLTDKAIDRYVLGGKVSLEKSASVDLYKSVRLNDEITYTISVKNNDTVSKTKMYAIEYLPEEVEFISCTGNGTYISEKNMIVWQFSTITSGSTNLTYKVKVKNVSANIGNTIDDSNSNVCGIALNSVKNQIEHSSDLSKVVTESTKLIGTSYSNNLDFVKDVYKNAWNVDILESEVSSERVLKDLLSYWEITPTATIYEYLVVDGYGGVKFNISVDNKSYNNYLKLITPTYLQPGDIIFAQTSYGDGSYNVFLYQSTSSILACNSGTVTTAATTEATVKSLLVTIEAYDRFVILRPSLVY